MRFALGASLRMLALYAVIYYPYAPAAWPARVIQCYLGWLTQAAAFLIGVLDDSVRVADETVIDGKFPLRVVLDCAALDAQALYLAAVLAFPAPARAKLLGALAGACALTMVNLARVATPYFAGVHAPERFDLMHEEIMLLVIVTSTFAAFCAWVLWIRRAPSVLRRRRTGGAWRARSRWARVCSRSWHGRTTDCAWTSAPSSAPR